MSARSKSLTPMAFMSHGTPLMSVNDCEVTKWWEQFGAEVLASDIKGIVVINSHWVELDDRIRVAVNPDPVVELGSLVPRERYDKFKPTISAELASRVTSLLKSAGFPDVEETNDAVWADAPATPSMWMFSDFSKGTPPMTTVSLNAKYDPVFHVRMGQALRPLRKEGIMIMASGAMVHNIFRANHIPVILNGDSLQKGSRPAKWAIDFDQSVHDIITSNTGSDLAGALVRMTRSPRYLDAHPSNDHFYPLLVLAGAFYEDEEVYGQERAKTYEMKNLINTQYVWGEFKARELSVF